MLKNIFKSALIGAAMLAVGATAVNAATYEINIYGASAQYKYWTTSAPKFLSDTIANGGLNCATVYAAGTSNSGIAICPGSQASGNGIQTATGWLYGTGSNGDNQNYIIRYTALNSIEGIRSVQDENPDNVDAGCNGNPGQRQMGSPLLSSFTLYTGTNITTGAVKACTDVTVGVSDVAPATFNQESHGYQNYNSATYVDRYAQNVTMGSGFTHKTNLVIPFTFIKNNNLTLTNISRSEAGLIFSTQVLYWEDLFGGTQTNLIDACFRHAGSGTHATLDAAVMRGDYTLQTYGEPDLAHNWFNESSGSVSPNSGMAGCVNTKSNAIGYADADITLTGSSVSKINYQGFEPTKANVLRGLYDFWSYQHGYYKNTEPAKAVTDKLFAWSSKGSNMPSSLATYWAAEEEMNVYKATDFNAPQWK